MRKRSIVNPWVLIAVISFITAFTILALSSCTDANKDPDNTVISDSAATTETIAETTESTENGTQYTETDPTESTEPVQNENVLTFKGNDVNGNTAVMILEVNIVTGEVTGIIQMGFAGFDMNMSSTKICNYVLTGTITGDLELETLKIRGELKGRAETDTQVAGCNDYKVDYAMAAEMMEDYSRIKGYFDPKTQDKYEFFLKNTAE